MREGGRQSLVWRELQEKAKMESLYGKATAYWGKARMLKFAALTIFFALLSSCQGERRTISVSGFGTVTFVPDTVSFTITVRNLSPTLEEATALTKETTQRVVELCDKYGIGDEDIVTSYMNSGKEYANQYGDGEPKFLGYASTQSTAVSYQDLPKFEEFSRELLALEITSIHDLSFSHSQYADYASEADMLALDDAKRAAEKIAGRMKIGLGEVLSVASTGDSPEIRYGRGYETQLMAKDMGGGIALSPGILTATKRVDVVFGIR
jgi:uncharacterized protein YggE